MPDSNPRTSLSPMLSVRRGSKAVDFYQAAFGATVLFRLDGDDGGVVAQLSIDGAEFWVADVHVSLCQVERALLLARSGERAKRRF